jgi:hypothetical protein
MLKCTTVLRKSSDPSGEKVMAAVWSGQSVLPAAPADRVAELLETLITLGQTRQTAEERFVG